MIEQGLPVGNGRLGALASNDPGHEVLLVTDATMWTGGLNDTLDSDGQFPYGRADFGSLTLLANSPSTSPTTTSAPSPATAAPSTSSGAWWEPPTSARE